MALWRKNMALSGSQKRKNEQSRQEIVQTNTSDAFEKIGFRPNSRIDSADNRRAAGIYVRNF